MGGPGLGEQADRPQVCKRAYRDAVPAGGRLDAEQEGQLISAGIGYPHLPVSGRDEIVPKNFIHLPSHITVMPQKYTKTILLLTVIVLLVLPATALVPPGRIIIYS